MAIREYIGARYVPRFMGVYDNTQVYEALDVVDNGLGTSYIAKVPTPAGTPLTNTTYWAIYGATSGAIINLQNQIGDLSQLLTTDKDNLVEAINEDVQNLADLAAEVHANNAVFIGDSYTEAVSLGADQYTDRFSKVVCDSMGLNEFNYADGGSGYMPFSGEIDYEQQLINAGAAMTAEQKAQTKYVFICGGRNDPYHYPSWTLSQLYNATEATINRAVSLFPNALIVGVLMQWDMVQVPTIYARYRNDLIACWCAHANRDNIMHLDNAYMVTQGRYGAQISGNIHWNVAGHKRVADYIVNALNGTEYVQNTFTHDDTLTNGTGFLEVSRENNIIDVAVDVTVSAYTYRSTYIFNKNMGANYGTICAKQVPITLTNVQDGTTGMAIFRIDTATDHMQMTLQLYSNLDAGQYIGHASTISGIGS